MTGSVIFSNYENQILLLLPVNFVRKFLRNTLMSLSDYFKNQQVNICEPRGLVNCLI